MRKITAILLLACYMLCAFGITFSFHHCRGELKYVNVHSEKKKKCCKGKEMPKNCCKTVKVVFKKADDKGQSFLTFKPAPEASKIILSYPPVVFNTAANYEVASITNYLLRPPPLRTASVPLYISYSVYLI